MIPGSASGLRVTPWSSAPDSPSAAPASSPMIVRGTRISSVTVSFTAARAEVAERAQHLAQRDVARPLGDAEEGHQTDRPDEQDEAEPRPRRRVPVVGVLAAGAWASAVATS